MHILLTWQSCLLFVLILSTSVTCKHMRPNREGLLSILLYNRQTTVIWGSDQLTDLLEMQSMLQTKLSLLQYYMGGVKYHEDSR